jgi:hypothetical protein
LALKDAYLQTDASFYVPRSNIPAFVAQKSSTSKPDLFEDVDQVTITLANPRGFGPDLENQQANEVVKRSLETAESRQAAQVSVLLEPMSYQSIVPGQVFNVKMTKNVRHQQNFDIFLGGQD